MITKLRLSLLFSIILCLTHAFAQVPNITYSGPQTFTTGIAITPVKPTNTGGTVPAFAYGQVSTFAGTAGAPGRVNGTGTAAQFNAPEAVTVDASGTLFVVDLYNYLVRKITTTGVVSTYAGTGQPGVQNGPAAQATFAYMTGITADASGNVYISDQGSQLIRKISAAGDVSTVAGEANTHGFANGQGTTAIFNNPNGIAVDKNGNLYVMDLSNYLIRKITPAGFVSTFAGKQGVNGSVDGPDTSATFNDLTGCAIDATGNLYVTDGNEVRKISTDGMVSTFAGSVNPGAVDGIGTAASFDGLKAISIDALGNLYVSDSGNATIREITPNGMVKTIAGTNGMMGSADGIGGAAQFGGQIYGAVDLSGNIFVADAVNSTIRKLSITGYAIGRPLPTGLAFDGTNGDISGSPVDFSPATDYPVTGYNLSGNNTTNINITITGTLSFPLIPATIYGIADFSPAVSTSGSITYTSSNSAVATVVSGKIHVIGIGTSTITATNGNTTLSQVLTVNTAPLTVIADNQSKNYNTANPALTITYDGFVNGEDAAIFTTQPTISTIATSTTPPGSYPINVGGAVAKNYSISFVAGTLTILGGSVTTAAPKLSYPAVLNYNSGVAITAVMPTNTGGPIPANAYAQITAIAGAANYQGGYMDGPVATASFSRPSGISIDSSGNIYIADAENNVIRKISTAGIVSTFAGNGGTKLTDFVEPQDVTTDAAGNIYLPDTYNNVIKEVTPQGAVSIFAGGGSQLDGQGTQASFLSPSGITIDKSGNLFVVDQGNYLIRKITSSGLVTTIAGQKGVPGYGNGQGTAATFLSPIKIAVDTSDNLYVSDGNLIRKITAGGLVSTFAGGGSFSSIDGTGTAAGFSYPQGIAAEPNGTVYVVDHGLIRKITPGGVVSTIVGIKNPSGTMSQNTQQFDLLGGLTADPSGNLYACDIEYNLIAKITATGYTIDKTLPAGLVFDATTGKISGKPTAALPPTFFTVNAYNLGGASTSIIKLSVAASSVAELSSLHVNTASLSPAFSTTQTTYTATVPYATSSITLTPTSTSASAVIKVNGTAVLSGSPSGAIPLSTGANIISTIVTAQDSVTTKTYTLTVTRAIPSTNCNLSALTPNKGTLTPAFAAGATHYTNMLTNGSTSVSFTPTTQVTTSTVAINGTAVLSGHASGAIALAVGSNIITTIVTAQDGTTQKTYTVNVIRPSTNAKLSALTFSAAGLVPAFNPVTTSYTSSVPYNVTSTTVTPTAAVAGSTITVNGTAVASGTASGAIALSMGANKVTVVVTAQDGVTTNTYTVSIYRNASSNNAGLANLTPSKGVLSPAFTTPTVAYADTVINGTASITLTPAVADATATVAINGTSVTSGKASGAITLSVGSNIITTVVTAQDGTTKKTYTVNVIRPSTNAKLSALTLSSGPLTPVFNTNTTSYTASVTNTTTSVTITPTVAVTGATIKVDGTAVASGSASAAIALSIGSNTITTVVTAQDGVTTDTYTINVTRPAGANIPDAEVSVQTPTDKPLFDDNVLIVHQGISPNGDGVNDFLVIDGILTYPDNKLSIMNRNGQLVFEAQGYDNATKVFDGHSNKNGQMQLPGTYFYELDYKMKGVLKHKTGFLVLKY